MNDKIYLLSKEEYERYENKIPPINCDWWLRTPCDNNNGVATVGCDGFVGDDGMYCYNPFIAIRPVIKIPYSNLIGKRIIMYNFSWIVIDKDLAIAEVPIAFMEFGEDKDYEISYVREFLLNWIQDR